MKKGFEIKVLNQGYVRYIDHLGTDQRIVEAARISYKSPSKGSEADKKLLRYLYRNKHTSPFEQCNYTLNIKMPIFCMRQFVRHRTFRLNEVSARYSELEPTFYIPDVWRTQDNVNKQGSVEASTLPHKHITALADAHCKQAYILYLDFLKAGIAKELARCILPVNIFTEIYVNCDLHNLMHFLRLRLDSHAQSEIREIAEAMFIIMKELYPWTAEIFEEMLNDKNI